MLLFSTILSVNDKLTKDKFIQLVIKWNKESPHPDNVIPDLDWHGERNIRFGNDQLWLSIEEYRNQNIIAVRYEKTEASGVVWDTDFVMNFNEKRMAIRLDRSYYEEALKVDPRFSTPHFISLLINEGYLKDDRGLPILREPITIDANHLNVLADIINGKSRYRLPVVYISKNNANQNPIDVHCLAGRLKGVAHVFVEQEWRLNNILRNICNDRNEYNGAIGIYYPNRAMGHKKFLYHSYTGSAAALMKKVITAVIQYSNLQKIENLYTWPGVNNAILRDKYSSQKDGRIAAEEAQAQTKDMTDKLLEGADAEIRDLQRQITDLTHLNDRLTYENQGLRSKLDALGAVPLLVFGDEDEFFEGEIREMVIRALKTTLKSTDAHTRYADVLKDIIRNNDNGSNIIGERTAQLKIQLKGYKNVSNGMKLFLESLGFVITEEGKHYKLTYYGDSRYSTVIPKTPSDNRSGMNVAMQISKLVL